MSARDKCEPEVISALEKVGWSVTKKDYFIRLDSSADSRIVYADLHLDHAQQGQAIIAEVKCFSTSRSDLDEFYEAIGQYQVYRSGLYLMKIQIPIYLVASYELEQLLFTNRALELTLETAQINLVLVDLAVQEVRAWKHYGQP